MKIIPTLIISDQLADTIIKSSGLPVKEFDFGYFRNENHNSPVWIEDIKGAIHFEGQWISQESYITHFIEATLKLTL